MSIVNYIERKKVECQSCIGQPKEHILEVLGNGVVTTIELFEENDLKKYSELFESFGNASQITKLILSNKEWGGIIQPLQTEYLEKIFTCVGHLETLSCFYDKKIIKMMEALKNLKSVTIRKVEYGIEIKNFFDTQVNITSVKLTIESENDDGIKMLTHLSKNKNLRKNLTELKLQMNFNADALEKIKTFQNLQVLRMDMVKANFGAVPSVYFKNFPKNLRYIKIGGLKISCSQFFSLLDSLESLMVFDVGTGDIFLDTDEDMGLGDSGVTTFIATRLIQEHPERTINILRQKSCSR